MKTVFVILFVLITRTACTPSTGPIIGIDISHHQGSINWDQVSTWDGHPIQFIYIKATEGATYQDNQYASYFKEAKKRGFKVGSYHYFRTTSSVADQFANFKKVAVKRKQGLIPMVDIEEKKHWNNKDFHQNLKKFLRLVEAHYGVKPMLYSVNSFYNHHLSRGYEDYPCMIGRYGPNEPNIRHNNPWTIWQFSETGKVKGIEKKVDIDKLNPSFQMKDLLMASK